MNKLIENIEKKISLINEEIFLEETKPYKEFIISEMKRIGIEKLPYSYSALKNFIDPKTMDIHYNKHYRGYVDKLNKALSKKDYGDVELENIVKSISRYNKEIRNNAGGAFNHALFWKMLSPKKQEVSGKILDKINRKYGTFNEFKKKFESIAQKRFGSGWVWVVLTRSENIKIVSTPNQDNPLMNIIKNGGFPILGLDLWEHSYYLKYQNKRDEYIKNFWDYVNWEFVNSLIDKKTKKKPLTETIDKKNIILEDKFEGCTKDDIFAIRSVFNMNGEVVKIFREWIDKSIKEVFPDKYYGRNEYDGKNLSGIYNLEQSGRSIINKLNTHYVGFCILLKDINKVLRYEGRPEIKIIGVKPSEQLEQTKRLGEEIYRFKDRIFNVDSPTFKKIMDVITGSNTKGQKNEDNVIKILKSIYGDINVKPVGALGSKEDALLGIDCIVTINGKDYTIQIKPFGEIIDEGEYYRMKETGKTKKYNTDVLAFIKGDTIYLFNNNKSKIDQGDFYLPKSSLLRKIN